MLITLADDITINTDSIVKIDLSAEKRIYISFLDGTEIWITFANSAARDGYYRTFKHTLKIQDMSYESQINIAYHMGEG